MDLQPHIYCDGPMLIAFASVHTTKGAIEIYVKLNIKGVFPFDKEALCRNLSLEGF